MDYSTISAEELALTCFRSGDERAWAEFVRRFHPLIARIVLRVAREWGDPSPQVVDDLVQDTYLKLCADRTRLLHNFIPLRKDSIYGYIKVFTANLVRDHFKASRSQKRGGPASGISIDIYDANPQIPCLTSSESIVQRSILVREVDACLQSILAGPSSERDRRIFWLYYRSGLAASSIAALPNIDLSTKGVESTLLRLTRQIRERLGSRPQNRFPSKLEGVQSPESL